MNYAQCPFFPHFRAARWAGQKFRHAFVTETPWKSNDKVTAWGALAKRRGDLLYACFSSTSSAPLPPRLSGAVTKASTRKAAAVSVSAAMALSRSTP
jgi:hypothetical protein